MKKFTVVFSIICLICIVLLLVSNVIYRPLSYLGDNVVSENNNSIPVSGDEGIVLSEENKTDRDKSDETPNGEVVSKNATQYSGYDYVSWSEWDVPKHSREDIRGLLSYEDTGWRKAYVEVLLKYETAEGFDPQDSRWDLYDLDGSGVPELVYMPYTSGGWRRDYSIYAYVDDSAELMFCATAYDLAYCPDENLVCWEDWNQGYYYNMVLRVADDRIAEQHSFYTDDGAVDEDAAFYTIDERNVTRDEFYDLIRSPESADEEENWEYIRVRFVAGEYDDIFFMQIYPNVEAE